MKTMLLCCLVAGSVACGPVESRVTDGTYRSLPSAFLPNAELQVDLAHNTAVFVPQTGSTIVLQLKALTRAQSHSGCEGRALLETFSVNTDVRAGGATLVVPMLQAGCTDGKANPGQVALEGASGPEVRTTVLFTR